MSVDVPPNHNEGSKDPNGIPYSFVMHLDNVAL
jgi:hypothetical protein